MFYHGVLKSGASNTLPQGDFPHWLQSLQCPALCKHKHDSFFLNFFWRSGVPNNIEIYPTPLWEDVVVVKLPSSEKKHPQASHVPRQGALMPSTTHQPGTIISCCSFRRCLQLLISVQGLLRDFSCLTYGVVW